MMSCWLLAIGCWLLPADARSSSDAANVDSIPAVIASGGPDTAARASPSATGQWWVGAWGAAARHSKFYTRLGVRHRDFYLAGIRVGRELPVSRHLTVDYFVDVVPLLVSTENPVRFRKVVSCSPRPCSLELEMDTETARGFGVTPIGIQVRGFPQSRVQPVLGLSLGAAWYDMPVPDPDEQRLNFMGDLTAGVQIRAGRSSAIVTGVRQHHTSNAETGRVNPGIDSRVVYLGVSRSLDARSRQ